MRSGIFFNHEGVTREMVIGASDVEGVFVCVVEGGETFFEAPEDCELVDLICFAVEAWREEFTNG